MLQRVEEEDTGIDSDDGLYIYNISILLKKYITASKV
jgi:hypothetical protein